MISISTCVAVFALRVHFVNGFILDGTTTSPNGITESHFIMVMKLLIEEKEQRQHLEAVVNQIHSNFIDLQQKYFDIQQDHFNVLDEIKSLKNKTIFLNEKDTQSEQRNKMIESEVIQMLQELAISNNSIESLKEELNILKQMQPIHQIQDIKTLRTEMTSVIQNQKIIQNDVSVLTGSQQARKEDFLGLYNLTLSIKAAQDLQVAITSCAVNMTTYSIGEILIFPDMKTHFGVTNSSAFTSTGVFTCEYPGLYLVSVTVLSQSFDAKFTIYLNSSKLKSGYVSAVNSQLTDANDNFHTGTSMIVVDLRSNDVIFVKAVSKIEMNNWDSCMTLIKIQ